MPRKKLHRRIDNQVDPVYGSHLVHKFVNSMMWDGKKNTAEKIFYAMLEKVGQMSKEPEPIKVWKQAMTNVTPLIEVKSRRIGGATYQVPIEVSRDRKDDLAIRWLLRYSRGRKGRSMADRLAAEVMDASKKEGGAYKKREDTHKMAAANKAFAHYKY